MKDASKPVCPVHNLPMDPATHWISFEGRPFPKPIYVCTSPGCLYCHDDVVGYRELPETAPIGQQLSRVFPRLRRP
jgi:hypothetical protein